MSHDDTIHDNSTDAPQQLSKRRIGELLSDRGLITEEQLNVAIERQQRAEPHKQLSQILIEMDLVTPQDVVAVLAESVGTPYTTVTPEMVQTDALSCLPVKYIDDHNLLPLSLAEGWLTVAMEQFTNVFLIEDIGRRSNCQVQVVAADGDNIREARRVLLPDTTSMPGDADGGKRGGLDEYFADLAVDDVKIVEQEQRVDDADLMASASDSPVVRLVNRVIYHAVEARASDIHIEPDDETFRVRYRVDGELIDTVRPQSGLLPAVVSRIKIMAGMDISERRLPQDGGLSVSLGERSIDLRVSTMATKFGEKVVMRIVDHNEGVLGLDALGLETGMLQGLRAMTCEAHGIMLVTGPTGSGKTTTLYGALSELISDRHNISTIEDPVERRLPGTNQFQVNAKAGFTFASALRSLLRQDPDIIMVGEIRDTETAKLATEAALTGHLVLSTLHTNDAATAVPRLVNMGVESYLVAASLRGVLAQRLVRRICPHCRVDKPLDATQRTALSQLCHGECPLDTTAAGAGCSRCRGTGYVGRVGVFELLLLNEDLLTRTAREMSIHGLRHAMAEQGVPTLFQDGLEKVRRGMISIDGLLEIVSRTEDVATHAIT